MLETSPLVLETGSARFEVSPNNGGRVSSFRLDGRELIARVDEGPIWWGSYPMVPYAGRIRRGVFTFGGRRYEQPINMAPHAIHGVVFDRPWEVVSKDELRIRLDGRWPFRGTVTQRFELSLDAAVFTLELDADEPMPASMGWHPWFRRRLDGLEGEVALQFEPGAMYERDDDYIATGRLIEPTPPPWDDCFTEMASDPRLTWPGGPELTLSSDCVDWVVFNQRDDAICVEPQSAPPDAVNLDGPVVEPGAPLLVTMEWRWR